MSQGPKWLPGVVVDLQESAMYRVRLDNHNIIVHHINQLRHRQGPGGTVNPPTEGGQSESTVEVETEPTVEEKAPALSPVGPLQTQATTFSRVVHLFPASCMSGTFQTVCLCRVYFLVNYYCGFCITC